MCVLSEAGVTNLGTIAKLYILKGERLNYFLKNWNDYKHLVSFSFCFYFFNNKFIMNNCIGDKNSLKMCAISY